MIFLLYLVRLFRYSVISVTGYQGCFATTNYRLINCRGFITNSGVMGRRLSRKLCLCND